MKEGDIILVKRGMFQDSFLRAEFSMHQWFWKAYKDNTPLEVLSHDGEGDIEVGLPGSIVSVTLYEEEIRSITPLELLAMEAE